VLNGHGVIPLQLYNSVVERNNFVSEPVKMAPFHGANINLKTGELLDESRHPLVVIAKEDGCLGTLDKESVDGNDLLTF
jgi:nitrite reductase/ring-hydroxylating ferredoxin subunit